MTGDLKINGTDAYTGYGVNLSDGALSALMAPSANKDYVTNESRLENGSRVMVFQPRVASREVTLEMHIVAASQEDFLSKYSALCQVFAKGTITLWTRYLPDTLFRMVYNSCTQFTQLRLGIAKFSLRLTEPDPTDRELEQNPFNTLEMS